MREGNSRTKGKGSGQSLCQHKSHFFHHVKLINKLNVVLWMLILSWISGKYLFSPWYMRPNNMIVSELESWLRSPLGHIWRVPRITLIPGTDPCLRRSPASHQTPANYPTSGLCPQTVTNFSSGRPSATYFITSMTSKLQWKLGCKTKKVPPDLIRLRLPIAQ